MAASHDLMGHRIQVLKRVSPQVLQLELESTETADAVNGRRLESNYDSSGHAKLFWRHSRHDLARRVTLSFAIVDRLERREN